MNKELTKILTKLDKLVYTEYESNTLTSQNGFKVSIHTKFYHTNDDMPSVQALLDVRYKSSRVAGWGCMEADDTAQLINWFLTKKGEVRRVKDKESSDDERLGKAIFDNII